jgi:hypothetical protein
MAISIAFAEKVAKVDKIVFHDDGLFSVAIVERVVFRSPNVMVFDCGPKEEQYYISTHAIKDQISDDGRILHVTADMLADMLTQD